jgi:hypothetical protein
MGEEVADLVHQVDAKVGVADLDVDVHPADHQAVRHHLQVGGEHLVAIPVGGELLPPQGEGVGGGGDDRRPVVGRRSRHRAP